MKGWLFRSGAAIVLAWTIFAKIGPVVELPSDPIVARFVDATFSHEVRATTLVGHSPRDTSKFTLVVELQNNTGHKVIAKSANLYDKSGYFLLACRIADSQRSIAGNSSALVNCVASGQLQRSETENVLKKICEVDLIVSGRSLTSMVHPVPWPRLDVCI